VLLVVDANVFVSELLRGRGRESMRDPRLTLRVSERAHEEARHELLKRVGVIVAQGRMGRETADALLEAALGVAEEETLVVPEAAYSGYLERAAYRIPRDPDDAPTVALALALGGAEGRCGIWTNDDDFLGCGIPTWTTDTLLSHLRHTERGRG
jgi:predicted nucleic acid-binding protein